MSALVIEHISLRPKALSTPHGAGERPRVRMDSDMNVEVLLFAESFVTAWVAALVRLGAIVEVHVGVKAYFADKLFVAAWKLTLKSLQVFFPYINGVRLLALFAQVKWIRTLHWLKALSASKILTAQILVHL